MAYYKCGSIHPTQNSNVVVDTASGAIANFETRLVLPLLKTRFDFEATQDLHGQSGPYPAGGGKNIFPIKNVTTISGITLTVRDDGSLLINGTASQSFNATVKSDLKAGNYILSCRFVGTLPTEGAARCQVYDPVTGLTKQISNPDPSEGYTSVVVAEDLTNVEFRIRISGGFNYNNVVYYPQLESGSSLTSFSPYSNICPIDGVSEINVFNSGKNLCKVTTPAPGAYWNTNFTSLVTALNKLPVGTYTLSNIFTARTAPPSVQHGPIKIQAVVDGSTVNVNFVGQSIDKHATKGKVYNEKTTFEITESIKGNITKALLYCDRTNTHSGSSRGEYTVSNIMVELGSSKTTYKAYNGATTVIQLGGTYYGGYVTQDKDGKRELVVTYKRELLKNWTWTRNNTEYAFAYFSTTNVTDKANNKKFVCEIFANNDDYRANLSNSEIGVFNNTTGLRRFCVRCDEATTPEAFNTIIGDYAIIYELATPIVFDLPDGEPIITFNGTNNIYADTGDTSLQFRKIE